MDTWNHYASTVMVTLGYPDGAEADCSGVLLNSRLALTAAHCVCTQQNITTPAGSAGSALNGTACAERVYITTVLYGSTLSANYKEESTEKRYRRYLGTVRPHPEFQLLLNENGAALSEQANLATILLDEPVEGGIPFMPFPEFEAQPGEMLVMAGYASKSKDDLGGLYGIRYFRKNKVTRAPAAGSSSVFYEQQGAHLYNGYPGGPCLREEGQRRWLIGIASTGASQDLSCTSTSFFKSWIRAEIQHASQQEFPPPPDLGRRR
jgi:hypothetical protein